MCEYYVSENVMNVWNVVIKVGGMFTQLYKNLPDMQAKLCLWCGMYQRFLPGGGDSNMEQTRMLVGNFEFNP